MSLSVVPGTPHVRECRYGRCAAGDDVACVLVPGADLLKVDTGLRVFGIRRHLLKLAYGHRRPSRVPRIRRIRETRVRHWDGLVSNAVGSLALLGNR